MRGLFQKVFGALFGHHGGPSSDQNRTSATTRVQKVQAAICVADDRMVNAAMQRRRAKQNLDTELKKLASLSTEGRHHGH